LNILTIFLCARSTENGAKAKQNLVLEYPMAESIIEVVQLDINDAGSRSALIQKFKNEGTKLDVLVNNAGVFYRCKATYGIIDQTLNTNFWNTLAFTEDILTADLLSEDGKVIMISSKLGSLSILEKRNPQVKSELSNYKNNLSISRLIDIATACHSDLKSVQNCKLWADSVYSLSKLYLSIWVIFTNFLLPTK
jgi:NAD(P)-dependent dehydrogenase (short-subunit alcohol dehydrogenase family)